MRTSEYISGIQMQHDPQHEVPNRLGGVLPKCIPLDQMPEADRIVYEAYVQAERVRHRAEKIAVQAEAAREEAEAQAKARTEADRKAQALAVSQANPLDLKTMQKSAEQTRQRKELQEQLDNLVLELANKLLRDADDKKLIEQYGSDLVARAYEQSKTMKPRPQQAFAKHRNAHREADKELGRALTASGVGRQHSVEDFKHVLFIQLNFQAQGENPPVSVLLNKAYPDDPGRAKSIGNSKRANRVEEALELESIKKHPITAQVAAIYSAKDLQQRLAFPLFRGVLAWNRTAFKMASRIILLEAKNAELTQQYRNTERKEVLSHASATTLADKVLALHVAGWCDSEIATELGKTSGYVRVSLSKARSAGKIPKGVQNVTSG